MVISLEENRTMLKSPAKRKLYLKRSEKALEETQNKYGPYCYRIAKNILTVREDAEECVNDTWNLLWNKIALKIQFDNLFILHLHSPSISVPQVSIRMRVLEEFTAADACVRKFFCKE